MRNKLSLQIMAMVFLFTAVAWAMAPLADAIEWSSDTSLTTDPNWDIRSSVMQTRNGTLWVVWSSDKEENQWDLFYKTSTDNGSSWSSRNRLTTHRSIDEMPSVMQARDGTLWVVWSSQREGNPELFYKTSSNNGFSWSGVRQLTNHDGIDSSPSITQNIDGKIWVVWERMENGNIDIFYKTSSNNGASWSGNTRVTTHQSVDLSPSITWTWNGTLWIVWSSYRTNNYDLFYKTYSADEVMLADVTPLTTNSAWDESPSIVQSVNGTFWLVFSSDRGGSDYDIHYKTSSDFGSSWSSAEPLTTHNDDDEDPSIISTINRKILIFWESYRDSDWNIYYVISDEEITPVHDVAILNMVAWGDLGFEVTWVPRGVPIYINVTVENQGAFQETFNVTVYADKNTGDERPYNETQTGIILSAGGNTTLTFTWDTLNSSYGTFYISANATIVPGEYDTLDNIMLHGSKIGGITVPLQPHHIDIVALLVPLALVVLFVSALGAIGVLFFKLLMSTRPRWQWPLSKRILQARYAIIRQSSLP